MIRSKLFCLACCVYFGIIANPGMVVSANAAVNKTPPLKVAVLNEPGWPANGPFSASWYQACLTRAGYRVFLVRGTDMLSDRSLTDEGYDILIWTNGSYYPGACIRAITEFLSQGKTVMVMNLPFCDPIRVKDIPFYTHRDQTTAPDEEAKGWALEWVDAPYNRPWDFEIRSKPAPPEYSRLTVNPSVGDLLPGLVLPEFSGPQRWVVEQGAPALYSFQFRGEPAFADDICLPVFQWADASGKVVNSDFCLVRHHCARLNEGTMIVLGQTGLLYLKEGNPEKNFLTLLDLAAKRWPEEKSPDYYSAKISLKRKISETGQAYIEALHAAHDAELVAENNPEVKGAQPILKDFQSAEVLLESLWSGERKISLMQGNSESSAPLRFKLAADFESCRQKFGQIITQAKTLMGKYAGPLLLPPVQNPLQKSILFSAHALARASIYDRLLLEQTSRAKEIGLDNDWASNFGPYPDEACKLTGMSIHVSPGEDVAWLYGMALPDCPEGRDFLDSKTGQVVRKPGWKGTFFYRHPDQEKDLVGSFGNNVVDHLKKEMARYKEAPWVSTYQLPNEIQLGIPYSGDFSVYWPFWGKAETGFFQEWLQDKYKEIAKLNQAWNSAYPNFQSICLPAGFPRQQAEHAVWEDWAQCRTEALSNHVKLIYRTIKDIDPARPVVSRYVEMMGPPSISGLEPWDIDQYSDRNGLHGAEFFPTWYGMDLRAKKPTYASEWKIFQFTPLDTQENCVKRLRKVLWRDLSSGEVGWEFFAWSGLAEWGDRPDPQNTINQFVETDGIPRLVAWELKTFITESRSLSPILLDGCRKPGKVAIFYSKTSNRHQNFATNWWGLTPELYPCHLDGFDLMLQQMQVNHELLVEPELLAGCGKAYDLIIVPDADFLPEEVSAALLQYVKNGGNLFLVGTVGRFDAYGRDTNVLLREAQVGIQPAPDCVVKINDDWTFQTGHNSQIYTLQPALFVNLSIETLLRDTQGRPVVTRTPLGKGTLTLCGLPLGLDYRDAGLGNTYLPWGPTKRDAPVCLRLQNIFESLLQPVVINREVYVSDIELKAQPWVYRGQNYLFIVNLDEFRKKQTDIELPGRWTVRDVLLGCPVKASLEKGRTRITIDFLEGEGRVFLLEPGG